MIDADARLPEGIAPRLITVATQTAYRRFAPYAGVGAISLWLMALAVLLAG